MFRCKAIIAVLALLGVLCFITPAGAQKTMSVQVKDGQLKTTPSFLAKTVARVSYGTQVAVLQERGAWTRVSIQGGKIQGWIHNSAVTTKRIALKAGQTNVQSGVSRDELALAGKGFNEQVETAFRNQNKNLDYASINRMEAQTISPEQMQDFITRGGLKWPEEGVNP